MPYLLNLGCCVSPPVIFSDLVSLYVFLWTLVIFKEMNILFV